MKTETVRHTPGAARLDRELANAHGYLVDAREALLKQSETFESETALYAIADADKAIQRAGELESGLPDLLAAAKAIVRRLDNGDSIEPGWYEAENLRAAIAQAKAGS